MGMCKVNINKAKIKQLIRDGVISFFYWTIVLTPYMVFAMKVSLAQYMTWIVMQVVLVPVLGAFSAVVFRWFDKKFERNGDV